MTITTKFSGILSTDAGTLTSLNWLNVRDYGAKGDGSTDDTAAIQAALNAVPSSGGIVYFPSASYMLNSAALSIAKAGTILLGAGAESSKLLIGSSFTGGAALYITASNCQVLALSVYGASTTTTSNPIADAIYVTSARRTKVSQCSFWYINSWAMEIAADSTATGNPDGTQINQCVVRSCAGGIRFLGNSASGYAANSFVSDVQILQTGVTTGGSANMDGFRIEDAWDVLLSNVMSWVNVGTGSSLHIKGNCAASFIQNLDTLGPNTGSCVLIEDGPNGSPQNVQLDGGVIQQGNIGLRVSGGANQVHVNDMRFINNQTHAIQVDGTGKAIKLSGLCISQSGQAATGTNYDLNWSGTATGSVVNCWFGSPVVSTGTAGVQATVNVASGQNVKFLNAVFEGTNASASNWFTNLPATVLETTNGLNFASGVSVTAKSGTAFGITGQANGQRLFGANGYDATSSLLAGGMVGDGFDRVRWTADGVIHLGPGTATRDTTLYRAATGVLQTDGQFNASNLAATQSYTPTLSGGALTLGNGTMSATYSRIGASTVVNLKIVAGSTTTLASSGNLVFTLPSGITHTGNDHTGDGYFSVTSGGVYHAAIPVVAANATTATLFVLSTSNTFTSFNTSNGAAVATGTVISVSVTVQN